MITMRSRFYKKGGMIFISHLDLMRVFERAIRRANIPVSYTQGFNPHPIMAFATALGVGIASEGEYMDLQLDENMDSKIFMDNLNKVLPDGLKIIKSLVIKDKAPSLMSVIDSSNYLIKLKTNKMLDKENIKETIDSFLNRQSIIQLKEKRQKRGSRNRQPQFQEIDIRPLIKSIELFSVDKDQLILKMHLATGSENNLKPEVVVEKLREVENMPIEIEETRIQRIDLFVNKEDRLLTPLDEEVWQI